MAKKRKVFLVEKQVQSALGWRIAAHWLVFLALSIFVTCSLQILGNFERGTFWSSLEKTLLGQVGSIAVLIALLPWFIHDSLKLSNRFAGPMVRLRKSILELTNQDETPPISFRGGDFWQDIATDFNQLRMRVIVEREVLAAHGLLHADQAGAEAAEEAAEEDEATLPIGAALVIPSADSFVVSSPMASH
jgi:hypothetical protein